MVYVTNPLKFYSVILNYILYIAHQLAEFLYWTPAFGQKGSYKITPVLIS